ncbi:hypothetical protein [Dyadobacter arcticus]|uniref:Uncharacterized protein n=1 Tax=Dyadobacter arcticus TaxID=1078754 RepID=A0ABX0UP31_9BACT|nr:hypothetical protein [Dyadobacter arcticus]NIJ54697.1 hypothetical protein [Dyadobacter arcticus]
MNQQTKSDHPIIHFRAMTDEITLLKSNPLLTAEDFGFLKQEGIEHIQKLAGETWTEYNTSDPGITILEAVSYAITDLAYRTSFDMKDLLTPSELSSDMWSRIFYTARQILHCNPVTISDWRKVIIDIDGVRNAWIEPSKDYEVPIYVEYDWVQAKKNCEGESCFGLLTIDPDSSGIKENRTKEKQGATFEKTLKKLREEIVARIKKIADQVIKKSELTPAQLATYNGKLDALNAKWKDIILTNRAAGSGNSLKLAIIDHIDAYYPVLLKLTKKADIADFKKSIGDLIDFVKTEIGVVLGYLALGKDTSKILELEGLFNVIVEYEEDIIEAGKREEVRERVIEKLNRRRNLCEDFLSITSVDYDDFTASGLIVLKENVEPDEVLAQMAFTIYRYFAPRLNFYTIEQMMAKGYTVEEIFEGPALRNGFIDTEELENTDLFRDLRLSDLINAISDIDGVEAVTNFYIPKEAADDFNKDISIYFDRWLKKLREERKVARFDLRNSSFILLKKSSVTNYNTGKLTDRRIDRPAKRFEDLKAQDQAYKLNGYQNDFPIMVGENMEIEDYYPVQYSLPMVYGTGEQEVLPKNPKDKRTIQTYQLKGYLQFFEQILSGYHSQLNHLNDLFSFDETVEQTYYSHSLEEINNFRDLILDYDPVPGETDEHVFSEFSKIVKHLIEPEGLFYKRRNKFLNHLLARFDEDFSEYEELTRYVWKNETEEKITGDKIRFLQDYQRVSSQRGKGFNYLDAEHIWDSDNISGAERRIGRLLGFKNTNRHILAPGNLFKEVVKVKNAKGEMVPKLTPKGEGIVVLYLQNDKGTTLLTSNEVKDGECCVDEFMNLILEQAESRKNYLLHDRIKGIQRSKQKEQIGVFSFDLIDKGGYEIASGSEFPTRNSRNELIDEIIEIVSKINDNEGMHLVEHILLRPKLDTVLPYADFTDPKTNDDVPAERVELLKICLDFCDLNKGVEDEVDVPVYRVKVSRIPAEKCYNDEPWVLEIVKKGEKANLDIDISILFQKVFFDKTGKETISLLTFRRYERLNERLGDLREYGSEPDYYRLVTHTESNKPDPSGRENSKFSYEILNEEGELLAQTRFYETLAEAEKERDALVKYFSYQLDLYCEENACDHNEDPYSFRVTILLPCWAKRFRNSDYRYFVEKTIQTEVPAHIEARIKWVGISQMQRFETKYIAWLEEFTTNPFPEYKPVNELVAVLNTITECGHCDDDCGTSGDKTPPAVK